MKFFKTLVLVGLVGTGGIVCVTLLFSRNHEAKVTYHLVTDNGKELKNFPYQANVLEPKAIRPSDQTIQFQKNTDQNGNVTFTLPYSCDGIASGIPDKTPGYYNCSHKFWPKKLVEGKWKPWNPTVEVVVKPIVNPIPMYAQTVEKTIPSRGVDVGYDLEVGDWVMPNGKGNVADFIFRYDEKIPFVKANLPYDFKTTVSFSNKGDGIQSVLVAPTDGSALKMPRYSPETNYEEKLVQHLYCMDDKVSDGAIGKDQNYFFRVRTILDEQGNIKRSLYGKINGPIECGANGYIRFTYYLNPTPNDRNMEFDPKRNLFGNLSPYQPSLAP